MSIDDLKKSLIGKHVKIHNLDFEVYEKENTIKIIPHSEQSEEGLKTLPITHVDFDKSNSGTKVIISSKMRRIDAGGPRLIIIFCLFMLIAALMFMFIGKSNYRNFTYTLLAISAGIFVVLWIRLQNGYFDYVRKVRDFVKSKAGA